eukprot:gb/GECG01007610.1/.p1 GENE.gb/GECG01007610.1/~~gb/GECG01007610.1/.p1  ORF type:complete len:676 (+),score=80.71 gb/GECG01007610.1/:1-2028(+)
MEPSSKRARSTANGGVAQEAPRGSEGDLQPQKSSSQYSGSPSSGRPRWKLFLSKSTGKHYWMNQDTKKSQWEPPLQRDEDVQYVVAFGKKGENPRSSKHTQGGPTMIRLGELPPQLVAAYWNEFAKEKNLETIDPPQTDPNVMTSIIQKALLHVPEENYRYWNNDVRAFVLPALSQEAEHTLNTSLENPTSVFIGGFSLLLRKEATIPRKHIASVSVFRLKHGYRKSSKYANGLLTLANSLKTELPEFVLRVYFDISITSETILNPASHEPDTKKSDIEEEANCWEKTLSVLEKMNHVELVEFRHPEFMVDGNIGHQDLFGTLVRFLPLFESDCKLPRWADTVQHGGCVFVTDADFQGFSTEHVALRLIRWFSSVISHSERTSPELVALSSASSQAPRHIPSFGMPPFIANCVATRIRYPLHILENFLDQARHRKGLPHRYYREIHHPDNHNYTYDRRNVAKHTSMFPFGIDEFFLTHTLKNFCAVRSTPCSWLFVVIPNIDRVITQGLKAIKETQNGEAHKETPISSYEPVTLALQAAAGTAGENMATPESIDLEACAKWWPREASKRLKLYSKDNTNLAFLDTDKVQQTLESFRLFLKHMLESISLGYVEASAQIQQLIIENLYHINKMDAGRVIRICSYSLGNGSVEETDPREASGDSENEWYSTLWATLKE